MKLFSFNVVLQELNISMNQMASAQAIAFDGNDQLQILDASDNLISKVWTSLIRIVFIKLIDLVIHT